MKNQLNSKAQSNVLKKLVGIWATSGVTVGSADEPSIAITGTDIYELVSDGAFLLHRVNVFMGTQKIESIEVIGGINKENSAILMRSFDSKAQMILMDLTVENDLLKITGEGIRSVLKISESGRHMEAHWEKEEDNTWKPWMDMTFTKKDTV